MSVHPDRLRVLAEPGFDIAPPVAEPRPANQKQKKDKRAERQLLASKKRKSTVDDEHVNEKTAEAPAARTGEEASNRAAAVAAVGGEEAAAQSAAAGGDDDERPLSHKEKRLAKKRKLAAEQAGEDPDAVTVAKPAKPQVAASQPTTIGTTLVGNTPARSAHGVWVGNLNFATHPRELLAWFAERGINDVTRINMPGGKRSHENNRGFAYLDFPGVAEVQIAVGLSEQHLDGRKLLIKDSSDFTGRPAASTSTAADSHIPSGSVKSVIATLDPSALERPYQSAASTSAGAAAPNGEGADAAPSLNRTARKILSRQRNPAGPTLFIGNLGFETVSDDIRDMFDRNQRRASEWAPGGNSDEKAKKGKKGKGKQGEDGADSEGEAAGSDDEAESDAEAGGESEAEDENGEEEEERDEAGKGGKKSKKDKKDRGPLDLSKAKDAGIRKIRLGTFEDSGKCKGWAFVDFHLAAQATRALLNLHNHQLNGRKLNVEYASAEAVRRGGLGTRSAVKRVRSQREQDGDNDGADDGARRGPRKRQDRHASGEASSFGDVDVRALAVDAAASSSAKGTYGGPPRPPRRNFDHQGGEDFAARGPNRREKELPGGKRAKPGAALAMAQRASEAIVQSTGTKVVFD
ncbi:hypothetical protein BMF94_3122 [Rhodotorula taiwanensis]|uniref:RRM domain-containing protein n=1 Tax=Rhodotorula taiwanensis TaxID=741276 RepID=A0A2S5B9Z8_9BASI|nr:hypothetical protein BMF94_3122 [Rhodotorula taiwanensis]